jgi:nicotinate phosphoribosyltransferase
VTTQAPLGLHTDLYELRMVETYVRRGMTGRATFSLFSRPSVDRPWLVAAGLATVLEVLADYRFDGPQLDYLAGHGVPDETLDVLRDLAFEGEVWAVPDGTVVLGDEPLLEVTAPLPVAQLVETAVMNAAHLETLVATKAARCVHAAAGRAVVDFGFRRAHGLEAAVRAARAAWIGGVAATSNVAAGQRHDLPITGTMAHSFVQAFDDETAAFTAFLRDHPDDTTLLVDTYDLVTGVERAIEVALAGRRDGTGTVGAIRIDSDPLDDFAAAARAQLDDAGLDDVRILASGGLDEFAIADLVAGGAPIDGFGVGSALVTSSDKPTLDIAYKLVAYDGTGRAKYSADKRFLPGAKQVFRTDSPVDDVLELRDVDAPGTPLLEQVWSGTGPTVAPDPAAARERAAEQLSSLPTAWRRPHWEGAPPTPRIGPALEAFADAVEDRERTR